MINQQLIDRSEYLNLEPIGSGPIVYWMNRDQRMDDNYALVAAKRLANDRKVDLIVLFVLFPCFNGRKFSWDDPVFVRLGQGLRFVIASAKRLGLRLVIRIGKPEDVIPSFIVEANVGALITDYSPLKEMRHARETIAKKIGIKMIEIDAHNVIPVKIASSRQEWGAYTLRPKINRLLPDYLEPIPSVFDNHPGLVEMEQELATWISSLPIISTPEEAMRDFIDNRLTDYHFRNNPNYEATSRLSSYLHFGNLAATRLALEVIKSGHRSDEFIEEMVVRRELAENYCAYNPDYDSLKGIPGWARKTLDAHRNDKRPYIYDLATLESAKTHDPVWNAAQLQLIKSNYMHGYMRMYWAKKILEWTPDPDTAFAYALYLNDKYQLDGRDPNGYVGIAWALGGVHDRPWAERPIFGMIRYMNMAGLKRKFGVEEYIRTWNPEGIELV